ncbi:hypothetical protein COO60DRAFT_1480377 [Scenedesmus sp. NREL 46B-D3]|nr:hypothetical protein COO60DRAFT_1480377 [Scenedesmus sp. NREL 46B-D3]
MPFWVWLMHGLFGTHNITGRQAIGLRPTERHPQHQQSKGRSAPAKHRPCCEPEPAINLLPLCTQQQLPLAEEIHHSQPESSQCLLRNMHAALHYTTARAMQCCTKPILKSCINAAASLRHT